jgi:hypothetical protein
MRVDTRALGHPAHFMDVATTRQFMGAPRVIAILEDAVDRAVAAGRVRLATLMATVAAVTVLLRPFAELLRHLAAAAVVVRAQLRLLVVLAAAVRALTAAHPMLRLEPQTRAAAAVAATAVHVPPATAARAL